jgi:hypothetical protein
MVIDQRDPKKRLERITKLVSSNEYAPKFLNIQRLCSKPAQEFNNIAEHTAYIKQIKTILSGSCQPTEITKIKPITIL